MSMAIAYNMKKRRMAEGGDADDFTKRKSAQILERRGTEEPDHIRNARNPKIVVANEARKAKNGGHYAEGGEVCPTCHGERYAEGGDVVDRIMGKYSEGGRVANDIDEDVDCKEAQFDDLPIEDDLSEHETEANSGDDVEDAQENEDENDMVSRIMRSRSKRDKNPRTA